MCEKALDAIKIDVLINSTPITMELDAGASYSLICEEHWKQLGSPVLRPTHIVLRSYRGQQLPVLGAFEALVCVNGSTDKAPLLVVCSPQFPALFGRDWLASFHLDWASMCRSLLRYSTINSVSMVNFTSMYLDLFATGLGHVTSVRAHIEMRPDSTPKFFKPRAVPFTLKPKIEADLERLVAAKVLEPILRSDWATPIVPVLKSDGSVRICGDFRLTIKPRTGRSGNKTIRQRVRRVHAKFTKNPNITITTAAAQLGMSRSTAGYIKLTVCGLKARSKKFAPKYTEEQATRAKRNGRNIYRKRILSDSSKIVVLDDESYFPLNPSDLSYSKYYHVATSADVPPSIQTKPKAKFCPKVMVWQAIDEKSNRSEPCFFQGTVNGHVYLKECIRKRLIPFIKKHHRVRDVLFWPDLASCHYTEAVRSELRPRELITLITR